MSLMNPFIFGSSIYSIDNITYSNKFYDFTVDITSLLHLNFSGQNDSLLIGNGLYNQYDYTQSDFDDITTLSKGTNSYSAASTMQDAYWLSDGSAIIMVNPSSTVYKSTAGTNWDISTLGAKVGTDFSSFGIGDARALVFRGGYMYILDKTDGLVYQFSWDVTEGDLNNVTLEGTLDISNGKTGHQGMDMSIDGKILLVLDTSGDSIDEYGLVSAHSIYTGIYNRSVNISSIGAITPTSIRYTPNGNSIIVTDSYSEKGYQFDLNK